jgi:RimJ/RimL family protein N-acetyltransferase
MLPLASLHAGGLRDVDAPLSGATEMHGWIVETAGGIAGFLGLSGGGHLMPHWPGADWRRLRPALAGRRIAAVIGPGGQAPAVLAGLGLGAAPRRHQDEEAGFALALSDLRLPDVGGYDLVPLTAAHRDLARRWRVAYLAELFADHGAEARAAADVAQWIAAGSHRLLLRGGVPAAMCGFNARIPDTVQVGAVWTPPEARGQGLARRAVALHLAEVRDAGARTAVLFAANAAAAAAYRAIGFRPAGSMGVIELAVPAQVPPCR